MILGETSSCLYEAYSHNDGICEDKSKWMSTISDTMTLSSLSIPGTHDTMSLGWGGDIVQTQSKSLLNQLKSGIRFLDIRLAARPNSPDLLYSHHGSVYLYNTFSSVLDTLTSFLKINSSEFIIMRLKQEYTNESDATFSSLLKTVLSHTKFSKYEFNYTGTSNINLSQLRGKFIILQNFGGYIYWMPYNSSFFNTQDNYTLKTNWDLYSKWISVKKQLINANNRISNEKTIFINYLSGSGGSFPYFVASGKSNSGTKAPLLSTGLTEPAFRNYYPDFPRIDRLGVFATIAFAGTNLLTKDYIDKNKIKYVGIIVCDFPGQGLINSIINLNKFNKVFSG